jgi:hypothetical protein
MLSTRTARRWWRITTPQPISMGYDGIVFTHKDVTREIVPLRPEHIKSATGNNGEFDRNAPDIRFSCSG